MLRDGKPVGYVRAASYGHTLGGAVGLAMVEAGEPVDQALDATAPSGRSRSPAGCARRAASLKPLYDPTNLKIKA